MLDGDLLVVYLERTVISWLTKEGKSWLHGGQELLCRIGIVTSQRGEPWLGGARTRKLLVPAWAKRNGDRKALGWVLLH